ncbi:MAG: hypothetical protein FK733_01955 [Asgard group archaeon]|nr:hypothetical protein [Asgard group archaeon]
MSQKKKASTKTSTKSAKEKETKLLENGKKKLETITQLVNKTALELPSLVSIKSANSTDINGILQHKFETDYELIIMLEEFFRKLVLLLRYRSSYDEKLSQISRQIKNLKETDSVSEFKGNLQILGITLNDTEQIIRNYEEMYVNLFTEQALLQFQLMEQLAMFQDQNVAGLSEIFNQGIDTFLKLNEKFAKK